ncbi:MAG: 3-hydroxyacyl-CoA dehydrogenase NAD-binding domain-containing protein [Candidatus Obscuribacterales bacterium]|nr:3-hydroxyacyl-CoA dehydrogenase NAD-binding domain-containing protein [Candidatus Obscuribacterales bacterium]
MSTGSVQLKTQANGVGVVTIDVPDSKVNVLGLTAMTELEAILDEAAKNSQLKGLVFISGKKDNFIAGANIDEIKALQTEPAVKSYEASRLGKAVFAKIESLSIPTIAAINGTCLGGGCELALSCKYRIATDSKSTKIGLPETKLGVLPGWGGTIKLPRLVGLENGVNMIAGATELSGKKAWKSGLVDEVVSEENLLKRAEEIVLGAHPHRASQDIQNQAKRFLLESNPIGRKVFGDMALKMIKKKTKGQYPAPLEALKVIMKSYDQPLEKAFDSESQAFGKLAVTPVSKNLVGLFFAQTESKKMPEGVKPANIEIVGVVGAGVMGAEIAQSAAYSGYQVFLKDIDQGALDKGMTVIRNLMDGLVNKKKMTREEADKVLARVKPTLNYADMAECDLVIEAVVEIMKIKQAVLKDLEETIKKPFVFASNTSSLSVSEMAAGAKFPQNVVGVHFFNPVHKMLLVEIVKGKDSSNETLATGQSFAMKLKKTTVVTGDAPGFVVNRILTPYLREAVVLLEEGVPGEDIDKAMTAFGMPMGPLALMDEVGLDIGEKVIHVLHDALGDRMAPPAILGVVAEKKLLGKKGGKGLYLYDENGKRAGINPDITATIKAEPRTKLKGEIQDRLALIMVNEAARCLEEGIITEPSQLDLAMVFGTGFAPFYGGVLRFADQVGTRVVYQKLDYLSRVAGESYKPCALLTKLAKSGESFYKN